jgi:GntR family transcriptional regulator/MocR family aminotransferase
MAKSWATSGLDLHLPLTGTRVRAAVEQALRDAVLSGRLAPGTPLPSSRSLAADLGIARNTVADAYGQLVAEGWLVARQGSGTHVADRVTPAPAPKPGSTVEPRPTYDLRPGQPDASSFPRTSWLTATRSALATAPHHALEYSDPRGLPELRQALTAYLARARGVRTTPERLLVCSGTTQALSLLATVLTGRIAVEAHGLAHHWQIFAARGSRTEPLPLDTDGAAVELLAESTASGVLLTPAHQFPTGVPLAPARRATVVDWARARRRWVIEDDYDGEFRYDRQPVGAVQGLDPDVVLYCGTASKSLAPGVRLGWMTLPPRLVEPLVEAKRLADHQTSSLDQLALAQLLVSGAFDRHVRRMRQHYRRRRDALVAALRSTAPTVQVEGISAGQQVLVRLPGDATEARATEEQLMAAARARGLAVAGLTSYTHPDATQAGPALVVGYARPTDRVFHAAARELCRLLG